ncbi:MAG: chromosome partitioning protein ParA [SAR324 cluster bacterium]|uniref:Chromosome partitioning protein ParA n=1 Tax=SAR324 cluster bacterium TaxID=2024889 RepID=A0A2A4T6C6_9DELT|nr:MAG: chromosome partitioning protein ParA [SAR324 cluster bacterium]
MATIISFVSQKGGVGKTTSAVNLATAFAFGGYSVLLLDLDPQGSVRFSMGVKKVVKKGTKDIFLSPEIPLKDLIYQTEQNQLSFIFSNIDTIKIEQQVYQIANDSRFLLRRIQEEGQDFDFIIVDAPASTNSLAINAIYCSDLIIMPLQCESLAIKSLKRFLLSFNELQRAIPEKNLRLAGILLTMYDRNVEVHRRVSQQVYQALSDSVFETIIPRNNAIVEASALGKSVITYKLNSIGATAYIRLMDELVDKFSLR